MCALLHRVLVCIMCIPCWCLPGHAVDSVMPSMHTHRRTQRATQLWVALLLKLDPVGGIPVLRTCADRCARMQKALYAHQDAGTYWEHIYNAHAQSSSWTQTSQFCTTIGVHQFVGILLSNNVQYIVGLTASRPLSIRLVMMSVVAHVICIAHVWRNVLTHMHTVCHST